MIQLNRMNAIGITQWRGTTVSRGEVRTRVDRSIYFKVAAEENCRREVACVNLCACFSPLHRQNGTRFILTLALSDIIEFKSFKLILQLEESGEIRGCLLQKLSSWLVCCRREWMNIPFDSPFNALSKVILVQLCIIDRLAVNELNLR